MPSSSWRPLLLLDVVLLVLYLLSFSVALLRVVSIVSSYRDRLCHSHRLPQLGFLVLAALAAAVRCLAILLRELLPEGAPGWQLGLEAAPDALLVAAVSFLVYKFADIYHGILNSGSSRHKKFLKAFVVALLASNAALISVIAACWLSKAKATQEDDESISRRFAKVTQSCIAVSFLLQVNLQIF